MALKNILSADVKNYFDQFYSPNKIELNADKKKELLEKLNKDLTMKHFFSKDFAYEIEKFRNYLEEDRHLKIYRKKVYFSLIAYRLQFIDPENGTFSFQCEVSVGATISDIIEYLKENSLNKNENEILGGNSLGGVLTFPNEAVKDLLEKLFKVRILYGEISNWYSYFRYGNASKKIWLIQNFTLNLNQKTDLKDLPFDECNFIVDFSVGLGSDVVNIDLIPDYDGKCESLFSPYFSSGEFEALKNTSDLKAFGYLQDPSCYFENFIRFQFKLKRNFKPTIGRIILPLFLMSIMVSIGSLLSSDITAVTTQLLPAIFLAMVALQLTSSQKIPRGAKFSRLDKIFLISYLYIILLFSDLLIIKHCFFDKLLLLLSYLSSFGVILFFKSIKAIFFKNKKSNV